MDDKAIRGILIEWLQANYPEGRIYQEKVSANRSVM